MLPGRIFVPLEHICQLDVCLNRNPTEKKKKKKKIEIIQYVANMCSILTS